MRQNKSVSYAFFQYVCRSPSSSPRGSQPRKVSANINTIFDTLSIFVRNLMFLSSFSADGTVWNGKNAENTGRLPAAAKSAISGEQTGVHVAYKLGFPYSTFRLNRVYKLR